jgi:predicted metal-binding membrane protein
MSDRALDCYDYVNQPYPRVRDAVLANPHAMFRHATAAAAAHAATLHVRLGGIDLGTAVALQITGVKNDDAYDRPATTVMLEWQAANNPRMFPSMKATLVIFALSATETQLELRGHYHLPMGKLGAWIDDAVGHRLAEASVTRLLREVAGWLREALAAPSPVPAVDAKPKPVPQPGATIDTEC